MSPNTDPRNETAGPADTANTMSAWARMGVYAFALIVAVVAAFFAGMAHFEATKCSGPDFGGECDLAGLEGVMWSAAVLVLAVIAIAITEGVRARNRRRHQQNRASEA
ncbi:hypothetical protein GCM10009844_22870 [Nocardioides koreensis]|uniref:ABC transporter permease n=1 Tax=Nocardioides koreensis TaxID=433651 RepID=A0ABP5LFZ6_9ACTN